MAITVVRVQVPPRVLISFDNPLKYKVLSEFFLVTETKVVFKHMVHGDYAAVRK